MSKSQPTQQLPVERYDVYVVQEYESAGRQTNWIRIGVGFPHRDNKGFNLELQALPVGGKLSVRIHEDKKDAAQ